MRVFREDLLTVTIKKIGFEQHPSEPSVLSLDVIVVVHVDDSTRSIVESVPIASSRSLEFVYTMWILT